jgi:hypothetical protein
MKQFSRFHFSLKTLVIASLLFVHHEAAFSSSSYEVKNNKVYEIHANSSDELTENLLTLATDKENFYPEECKRFGVSCSQKTIIKVSAETTWTITNTDPITSDTLKTDEFIKNFPDIKETVRLDNGSDEKDKLVAQRILYERGLLPIPPTGNISHLTILAATYLQHLKNIGDEVGYIGPKTIKELNALKGRMADESYLDKSPLPPIKLNDLSPALKEVYANETNKINLIYNNPGVYETKPIPNVENETVLPFINYIGEIKLVPAK